MANGYVTFVISLVFIGACTAVIGDVAAHLGCFINLKDGVNAIAFVALGTSVPGTKIVGFSKWFLSVLFRVTIKSLWYTVSFILYILRIPYTLFLPYTLSFISYILRILYPLFFGYFIFYIVFSTISLPQFTYLLFGPFP